MPGPYPILDEDGLRRAIQSILYTERLPRNLTHRPTTNRGVTPSEVRIGKTNEQLDALSGTQPGSGEVSIYRLDTDQTPSVLEDTTRDETWYNMSESDVETDTFVKGIVDFASGQVFVIETPAANVYGYFHGSGSTPLTLTTAVQKVTWSSARADPFSHFSLSSSTITFNKAGDFSLRVEGIFLLGGSNTDLAVNHNFYWRLNGGAWNLFTFTQSSSIHYGTTDPEMPGFGEYMLQNMSDGDTIEIGANKVVASDQMDLKGRHVRIQFLNP